MPEVRETLNLDGKTPSELEQMRRDMILAAKGDYDNLSIENLQMLAAITSTLRRRSAGPPKAKAPAKGKKLDTKDALDLI